METKTTPTHPAYIARLIERQLDEGWSDREMARQLGINNATWSGIHNGRHRATIPILQAAAARFPEYNALLLRLFVPGDVSVAHASVARVRQD